MGQISCGQTTGLAHGIRVYLAGIQEDWAMWLSGMIRASTWGMTNPTYVNVECVRYFDHSAVLATIAIPASSIRMHADRLFTTLRHDTLGWFTVDSPVLVLQIPGSFVVRAK